MFKALITLDSGKKLILLGLSEKNIINLKKGLPISINEQKICEREIVIAYGKTEKDIERELLGLLSTDEHS